MKTLQTYYLISQAIVIDKLSTLQSLLNEYLDHRISSIVLGVLINHSSLSID